jgi:hypothetical protein
MTRRIVGITLALAAVPLAAPTANSAPTWHYVGRIREQSDYTSVGGGSVQHGNGRLVHDGARTVWQVPRSGDHVFGWSGPNLSVAVAPDATQSRQRACPVMRNIGTALSSVTIQIAGKKGTEPNGTVWAYGHFLIMPSATYQRYCFQYNFQRASWDNLSWDIRVSQGGTMRIDEIRMYQGGTTGPSVVQEIAAKRGG